MEQKSLHAIFEIIISAFLGYKKSSKRIKTLQVYRLVRLKTTASTAPRVEFLLRALRKNYSEPRGWVQSENFSLSAKGYEQGFGLIFCAHI